MSISISALSPEQQPRGTGRIVLPWKVLCADNERHSVLRTKGGGRRIGLTERYRIALQIASALASQQWAGSALRGSVCVSMRLYEPDKRRRDVANYAKMTMDCLTRVAYVDDSQIDELHITRGGLDRLRPRAEIDITALEVTP